MKPENYSFKQTTEMAQALSAWFDSQDIDPSTAIFVCGLLISALVEMQVTDRKAVLRLIDRLIDAKLKGGN